jgi:hypothetical protein
MKELQLLFQRRGTDFIIQMYRSYLHVVESCMDIVRMAVNCGHCYGYSHDRQEVVMHKSTSALVLMLCCIAVQAAALHLLDRS